MSEAILDLPFYAIIPYAVQIDKNLSSSEKLFFGQISGLARKHGYMWATNEQFSEMIQVPLKTVERWLQNLEVNGHIKRLTHNELIKGLNGQKSHFIKKRKIFIIDKDNQKQIETESKTSVPEDDSKKDCGTLENEGFFGTLKNEGSKGTLKNEGYKIESLNVISKQQPTPPEVVVVLSLEKIDIEESLRLKISQEYSPDQINLAVDRCLNWKSRPSDQVGIMTALKRADSWVDNPSQEQKSESNQQFLQTLHDLDGKELAMTNITIGKRYIEFVCGMKVIVYNIDENDFKIKTKDYIDYLKQKDEEYKLARNKV